MSLQKQSQTKKGQHQLLAFLVSCVLVTYPIELKVSEALMKVILWLPFALDK